MPSLLRPPRLSLLLLLLLIVVWGTNWITLKLALEYVPPIWSVFFRTFPACLIFWTVCSISGRARIPVKADVPIILSVGVLHMVVFSVIVSMGMQYLPAGRSIVVAYTTPLWVLPAAWLFLKERIALRQLLGLLSGLSGLILLLSPWAVNWEDHDILLGYGLVLLGSFFWAISIVYGRAHVWTTPLFELLPWQLLIASLSELLIALAVEGLPDIAWSVDLILYIGYSSLVGTAPGLLVDEYGQPGFSRLVYLDGPVGRAGGGPALLEPGLGRTLRPAAHHCDNHDHFRYRAWHGTPGKRLTTLRWRRDANAC